MLWRSRILLAALGCLLLGALAYLACIDPRIRFLPPAWGRGQWIVHPYPTATTVYFHRMFHLSSVPAKFPVQITGFQTFAVTINDQALPATAVANWKTATPYDLTPYLRVGENTLTVRVAGPAAAVSLLDTGAPGLPARNASAAAPAPGTACPPALLVTGSLSTDPSWTVSFRRRAGGATSAVAALYGEDDFASPNPSALLQAPYRRYLWIPAALLAAFLLYAVLPLRCKPWLRMPPPALAPAGFFRAHGLFLALFVLVAFVQIRNVWVPHPRLAYYDWGGHLEYIDYIATHHWLPLQHQGWEMFQPPLYYTLAAIPYALAGHSLRAAEIFTTCCGLLTLLIAYLQLLVLFPTQTRIRNLGFTVAAFVPLGFYLNALLTNDVLTGTTLALATLLIIRFAFKPAFRWYHAVLIGVALAAAALSKFTGLCPLAVFAAFLLLRAAHRAGRWRWGLLALGLAIALSAWFYVRNYYLYANPLVGNWDFWPYEQRPGYRTLGFYGRFGDVLFQDPQRLLTTSFWDGLYATFWTDGHRYGFFHDFAAPARHLKAVLLWLGIPQHSLPDLHVLHRQLEAVLLWLGVLPTLAMVLGFLRALKTVLLRQWDHPFLIVILTLVFTLAALLAYTFKLPYYSTIKSWFLLSLIPVVATLAGLGLDSLATRLGRFRFLLYAHLAVMAALVLYLFHL